MIITRQYHNYFIELVAEKNSTTCHSKKQAQELIKELEQAIEDLKHFEENARYEN